MCLHICNTLMRTNNLSREMQAFLLGYLIISICEIFSIGEFPLDPRVRLVCRQWMGRLKSKFANLAPGFQRDSYWGHLGNDVDALYQRHRGLPTDG